MYIDDDEDDLAIFKEIVSEINATYNINLYSDSLIAVKELNQRIVMPDIIFVDINMPRLSGKDILILIRQNLNLSLVPVIMYSTTIHAEDIPLFTDLGANDFLRKGSLVNMATKGISEILKKYVG